MADKTGLSQKDRTAGAVEITEDAFQEMMRGDGDFEAGTQDVHADEQSQPKKPEARHEEPTVVIDEPEQRDTVSPTTDRTQLDPNVQQLLSRVDSLERELKDAQRPSQPRTPEPSELEEVIPGVRLPKDRSRWPIRLTNEMVEKAGLSPDATEGLNILANALVTEIVGNLMPPFTRQTIADYMATQDTSSRETGTFFESFEDLKGTEDLLDVVERRLQTDIQEGKVQRARSREEYRDILAERTRRRIATLRGVTYEDYVSQLKSKGSGVTVLPQRGGRSRAVSTGGGRSDGKSRSGATKDFDDIIDTHLSGEA